MISYQDLKSLLKMYHSDEIIKCELICLSKGLNIDLVKFIYMNNISLEDLGFDTMKGIFSNHFIQNSIKSNFFKGRFSNNSIHLIIKYFDHFIYPLQFYTNENLVSLFRRFPSHELIEKDIMLLDYLLEFEPNKSIDYDRIVWDQYLHSVSSMI